MKKFELLNIITSKAEEIFVIVNTTNDNGNYALKISKDQAIEMINVHSTIESINVKTYGDDKLVYIG